MGQLAHGRHSCQDFIHPFTIPLFDVMILIKTRRKEPSNSTEALRKGQHSCLQGCLLLLYCLYGWQALALQLLVDDLQGLLVEVRPCHLIPGQAV